jgi:cell division protein FtsQ
MARSIAAPSPPRVLLGGVARPLASAARALRIGATAIWGRPRARIALIATLAPLALAGGWQLARHTSLTAIEHIQITGLTTAPGTNSAAIETALRNAAHGMSTLGVSTAALRAAVAQYPIVRAIHAHPSFPHRLRVEVIEQPPVAALIVGGARTAVAADGVVLGESYLSGGLTQVNVGKTDPLNNDSTQTAPGAGTAVSSSTSLIGSAASTPVTLPRVGQSIHGAILLQELAVLGAAPPALAREIAHVYMSTKGLTIALRGGLLAYFGDGSRPHAKWISLTRVLASPTSAGAAYIDVRLPERPAAGFPPGMPRPDASSTEAGSAEAEANTSHPSTAAELASGLDAAVSGNASPSASAASGSGNASTGASGTSEPEEAGSASPGESATATSTEAGARGAGVSEVTG